MEDREEELDALSSGTRQKVVHLGGSVKAAAISGKRRKKSWAQDCIGKDVLTIG